MLALAGGRLARRRSLSASRQNGSRRKPAPRYNQRKGWSSDQKHSGSEAREHQLLRHQFPTRLYLAAVHLSTEPQSLANRYRSLSDHHHRLPSQTSFFPSNHGASGAHHDPAAGLYFVIGLLSSSGPQPCPRKMPNLPRIPQAHGLLVLLC